MADQEIKTSIDALVVYLNEHGETSVTAVANALGVSENVIMGWSNVLEKANIIRILHKGGRVFLAPLQGKAEAFQRENKAAEQSHLEIEIESQIEIINQVSAKMDEFGKSLSKIDNIFDTKYKNVKVVLDRLNKTEKYMEDIEKSMNLRAGHIKEISDKAQKGYEGAQSYLAQLSSFTIDTNNASAVAQELHTLLNTYEKNSNDMSKNLESLVAQYRKNALEISRNIREKHDELKQVLDYEDKQIGEYSRLATDYKRKSGQSVRQTEQASRKMLDQIQKGNSQMEKLSSSAGQQISAMRGTVNEIKGELGEVSKLNESVVAIKKDLNEVVEMRDTLLSNLKKIQQDMKNATSKGTEVEDVKGRANTAADDLASLQGKIDKMGTDLQDLGKGK